MKRLVRCPNGHQFRCDEQHLGRRVKCPRPECGQRFVLEAIDEMERVADLPQPESVITGNDYAETGETESTAFDSSTRPPGEQQAVEDIRAELTKLNSTSSTLTRGIIMLALSIALFVALGIFRFDLTFTLVLIPILLLHETGHLLAMLAFGYRNVKMFFIPLFGAAVSGRKPVKSGAQEAIIAMAGPVPSLLLGHILLFVGISADSNPVLLAAALLIALNGFNLLPIFPLDGGRVVNDTLFARVPVLELIFRGITALAILALALLSMDVVFGIFGLLTLASLRQARQITSLARELRQRLPDDLYGDFEELPEPVRDHIIETARDALPESSDAKLTALKIQHVWERLNTKPPGALATLGLLAAYVVSLASVFVVPLLAFILMAADVLPTPSSGPFGQFVSGVRQGAVTSFGSAPRLHRAAMEGDHDALSRALDDGVDVNALDEFGQTALLLAAAEADSRAMRVLLDYGGDPDIANDFGHTPLHQAAASGCAPCVKVLLEAHAAIDVQEDQGHTPLHIAVLEDQPTIVKPLLEAGADPSIRCHSDADALHHTEIDPPLDHAELMRQYIEHYLAESPSR